MSLVSALSSQRLRCVSSGNLAPCRRRIPISAYFSTSHSTSSLKTTFLSSLARTAANTSRKKVSPFTYFSVGIFVLSLRGRTWGVKVSWCSYRNAKAFLEQISGDPASDLAEDAPRNDAGLRRRRCRRSTEKALRAFTGKSASCRLQAVVFVFILLFQYYFRQVSGILFPFFFFFSLIIIFRLLCTYINLFIYFD